MLVVAVVTDRVFIGRMDDDEQLVQAVRGGDDEAFGVLFVRHGAVARRVAARHGQVGEVDDVVAEVFARVLVRLRSGGEPVVAFRAYVLAAVRHEAVRRSVLARRCEPVADLEAWVPPVDAVEPVEVDERLRQAYAGLPERWRLALWHLEVEGRRPQELAAELGLSPNAVSALGYRARAALRSAYEATPRAA